MELVLAAQLLLHGLRLAHRRRPLVDLSVGLTMEPEEGWEEGADAAADRYESDMYKQFER